MFHSLRCRETRVFVSFGLLFKAFSQYRLGFSRSANCVLSSFSLLKWYFEFDFFLPPPQLLTLLVGCFWSILYAAAHLWLPTTPGIGLLAVFVSFCIFYSTRFIISPTVPGQRGRSKRARARASSITLTGCFSSGAWTEL